MIHRYEYKTFLPSRVATPRVVVLGTHSGFVYSGLRFWRGHSRTSLVQEQVEYCIRASGLWCLWTFLSVVVRSAASILLCPSAFGRLIVHTAFSVCHDAVALGRRWGYGKLFPSGNACFGSSSGMFVFRVALYREPHFLYPAAASLAGLLSFERDFILAHFPEPILFDHLWNGGHAGALLQLAFSRGRRAFRRSRLAGPPAPSSPFSLFPPTAALPGHRGLSPCPSASVFGGAA